MFPLSDDADVALLPSREVVASRRVVLVPHSPGTPRSVQDRSVGSIGSRFAVLESDDEEAEMESDSETDESDTAEHPVCRPTRRGGHDSAHCQRG